MIVSLRYRTAFLAMPKTGSTAIEAALAPMADLAASGKPELKHMTARKFDRFLRPLLATYSMDRIETVCLVREPLDWLASWYRYRSRPELRDRRRRTDSVDFEGFVDAVLSDNPPPFARIGRQASFLQGRGTGPGVDHVFRYEAFPAFAAFLSERFATPLAFAHLNVSPGPMPEIPARLRIRVEAGMADDYAAWQAARST